MGRRSNNTESEGQAKRHDEPQDHSVTTVCLVNETDEPLSIKDNDASLQLPAGDLTVLRIRADDVVFIDASIELKVVGDELEVSDRDARVAGFGDDERFEAGTDFAFAILRPGEGDR